MILVHITLLCLLNLTYGRIQTVEPPEAKFTVSQIISYYGYPCEEHEIQTEDGYILSVQRIPHGLKKTEKKKGAVLLQHGFIDSAATWVMNPPSQSLGFILADAGYDVWLSNSRGNTYSVKHVKYTRKDAAYWDFSFDEMAQYDLPAVINYALNKSEESQLHYVGHSQGTMIAFIAFSNNQELAKKIKTFTALAPVATTSHIKGFLKFASHFSGFAEFLFRVFGVHDFVPNSWFFKVASEILCDHKILRIACEAPIFLIAGFDLQNLNKTRLPVYVTHTPAGTSVKDAVHFVQLIKSGKFQKYDYGSRENMKRYKQKTAPEYDITGLKVPTLFFTATKDWLADPNDVQGYLLPRVNHTVIYNENMDKWNHLDFVWGENANKIIYNKMLNIIDRY